MEIQIKCMSKKKCDKKKDYKVGCKGNLYVMVECRIGGSVRQEVCKNKRTEKESKKTRVFGARKRHFK